MDNSDIADIVLMALYKSDDLRIDDVVQDIGENGLEIILTTYDEDDKKQVWIIKVEETY